jgi:hypothetical protein
MSTPKVYGLLLGLIVATVAGVTDGSSAPRQTARVVAEETWTIPGAGRTPGQNNTFFVSDLALTNLGSATANVTISFVGPGGLPAKPISLAAGATTVYRNILDVLWGANGLVGALSVRSDQPLVLRARTYNTAATGTFGVALPVFASGDLLAEGQNADTIWIQQSASGTTGFRTNVGVVFPDAEGGEAVVTFFDANGTAVGTLIYTSAAAGFQQLPTSSVAPAGLPVGRAQISVTRGRAAGYAVGVDNVTGDTSLYPFETLPAGIQDGLVSGVARLTGRNNTFFRTDVRFFNPTTENVTVTARFHASGFSNIDQPSATLTVPAGRVLEMVDVLDSIFHLPVGSGGAVRFSVAAPVAILARTSNVDPAGVQPGTFGAQQHPVPLASFLSSADAGAVVTGIRQDSGFRTNVGFAAALDGAAYNLTLKNSQGGVVAVTTGSLGAFGWAQPNIADLFPGTTIPADATLLVQVTRGSVDVYDASLDNASGDLVVTLVSPVPVAPPPTASIGPAGGSVRSSDGRVTLKIPAGVLTAPVTVSIAPSTNGAPNGIGSAYTISPAGSTFEGLAQAVLSYSNADLEGTSPGALGLATQEGSSWFGILGGSLDTVARTVTVPISSATPSATSTTGRVPQRAAATGNLAPYGSVRIDPKSAAVPVRGHVQLSLSFAGPASTASRSRLFFPLGGSFAQNVDTAWYVNGILLGNGIEGTIFGAADQTAGYNAPNCKPPINPVYIGATVSVVGGGLGPASATVGARIRVIERDWTIVTTYRSQSLCSLGFIWSLDYSRSHNGAFSLDDDGNVIDYLPGLNHSQTTTPAWCPGFDPQGCSQLTLAGAPIGDLVVSQVNGRLVSSLQGPAFDLTLRADIPGTGAYVTFTCPGHEPFLYLIPHATPPTVVQQLLVHAGTSRTFQVTLDFTYPGWTESAIVEITPIEPAGCP